MCVDGIEQPLPLGFAHPRIELMFAIHLRNRAIA